MMRTGLAEGTVHKGPWPTRGMVLHQVEQNLDEFADYLRKRAEDMGRRGIWWHWIKQAPEGVEIRFPVRMLETCEDPIIRRTMRLRLRMLEARACLNQMWEDEKKGDG